MLPLVLISLFGQQETAYIPAPPVVMVEFYTDWCVPCKHMLPIIGRLRLKGYPIVRLNAEDQKWKPFADRVGVNAYPSFLMMVDGYSKQLRSGAATEEQLEQWFKTVLHERFAQEAGVATQPPAPLGQSVGKPTTLPPPVE